MILFCLIVCLLYIGLIGSFVYGFGKVKPFINQDSTAKTKFSIVVPFRNEARRLPALVESLSKLKYPQEAFEVLFVDDESEDASAEQINLLKPKFSFQIIPNERQSNSPKKDAITTAIKIAKFEYILTTDADCIAPVNWLQQYDAYIQETQASMVCGPVNFDNTRTFSTRFQHLELMSLMGATIGGFGLRQPFMCNGANLCYSKKMFESLNGFENNSHIASGDDIFLLEKALKQDKKSVGFLKSLEATVITKPESTWEEALQQRIRWASKTSRFKNGFAVFSGLVIALMNALLVCLFVLVLFQQGNPKLFFFVFIIKLYIDFLLIFKSTQFFKNREVLFSFLLSSLAYPFVSSYIVVASVFLPYKWKGRRFKK